MKQRERNQKFRKMKLNWFPKINIFKYLSIFLIILFIFSIPTVIKRLIKIDMIECNSQFGSCNKSYQLGNYNFVRKQIEDDLNRNIQVSSYLIQYKIPSTIKIDLVLKKPKYGIKANNNVIYLIDKNGLTLNSVSESSLPTLINLNNSYNLGSNISEEDKFALKIIEKVGFLYSIQSAVFDNNELKIIIKNNKLIRFSLTGDVDVLVGSLRLIFSRLNDEANGIRMEDGVNINDINEIDLRFKNPVLR